MNNMIKGQDGSVVDGFDSDFEKELYALLHKHTDDPRILNMILMLSSDISEIHRDKTDNIAEFADKAPIPGSYFALIRGNNSIPFNYEALFNIIYDNLFHNDPIQAMRILSTTISTFLNMFRQTALALVDENQTETLSSEFDKRYSDIMKLHNDFLEENILYGFGFKDFCQSFAKHVMDHRANGEQIPPRQTEEFLLLHNYMKSPYPEQQELCKEAILRIYEEFYSPNSDRKSIEESFIENLPKEKNAFLIDTCDLFDDMTATLIGDPTMSQLDDMCKLILENKDSAAIEKAKLSIVQKFKNLNEQFTSKSSTELISILNDVFPCNVRTVSIIQIYSAMADKLNSISSNQPVISNSSGEEMSQTNMKKLLDDMVVTPSSKFN